MKLSTFGKKFTGQSATVSLMDDLGEALSVNPNLLFMGGGNPAAIPAAQKLFKSTLQEVMDNPKTLHSLLGVYQSPQGDKEFLTGIADYLNRKCGWSLTEKNIAISNGSQSAFSVLFNLFAGERDGQSPAKILLPVVPEYVGYADVGFTQDFFTANVPHIDWLDDRTFKYRVDFDHLRLDDSIGMLCASRPTNPTGNVLTDSEVEHLAQLAGEKDIPFVIDAAYGGPFPNIIFSDAKPYWDNNTVLILSLSKLGLPGVRTGIVVANEDVISAFVQANTILCLAVGNLGPAIGKRLLQQERMDNLCDVIVKPFYRDMAKQALTWLHEFCIDLPYAVHSADGAIFLWIWFQGLPISSKELYQRLKARGVLVLAGEDFFVGLQDEWAPRRECIRVTYCQSPQVVKKGLEILANEVRALYDAV